MVKYIMKVGKSILPAEAGQVGISLGASWTYGLYHDWSHHKWLLCYRQTILQIFDAVGNKEIKEAFRAYYAVYEALDNLDHKPCPKCGKRVLWVGYYRFQCHHCDQSFTEPQIVHVADSEPRPTLDDVESCSI